MELDRVRKKDPKRLRCVIAWMRTRLQERERLRLSATVTPKFFPLFFHLPQQFPLNTPPIHHYHYKISFSISTINFLSTNNYSWTHNTVFRVMNSDTLYLKREGDRHVGGAVGGHRCGYRMPPTRRMQGEGEGQDTPLQLV
jgi:hypothetical protein